MGLLLLLTFTLLSSYFHPGGVVDAQRTFTIRDINLSIEPSAAVVRDTNVTLRCQATVSSSGQEVLSREYTIYKDGNTIYSKTSSSSEDLLYRLPQARVSNSGKYMCMIHIDGKQRTSGAQKLTVTGLSKPFLNLNKSIVREGEELTASCKAPGETGSIFFYFYEDSKEILEMQVNSNHAEAKLRLSSIGFHRINCAYTVLVTPESFKSNESNSATVSVKELSITPVLEISPQYMVYEGDQLVISCAITADALGTFEMTHLYLSQGTKLLSSGNTEVNHSMVALAQDPGEFECRLEMGDIVKVTTKTVPITELFSVPTLTMSPAIVFQRENMKLTCRSQNFASERITREEITYTLGLLSSNKPGEFTSRALHDLNYTCAAQAKGIVKHSQTLTVRPKVPVSDPRISVVGIGRVILGQPFTILCGSDMGSLPIHYTLIKDYEEVNTTVVKESHQKALFTVTITDPKDITKFMCAANNTLSVQPLSRKLNATLIVPVSNPTLTVIPHLPEISEGDHLYLICGITGTPPVTFRWYRVGDRKPLNTILADSNNTAYEVPWLSKEHSGKYYCEAANHANNVVQSDPVNIEVHMALWKKALIGGVCLLAVWVLVVVCVLWYKSKRGKREAAAELSVKPSSPKSDDSLTVNLTHDTEVYNAATVRVDRAAVSVWSKGPPEADTANDEESSMTSDEPDVEYTEVVHPRALDPARVPLRKGTDTVYSELQNSPHGADDQHDYGSVEYAELNGEQPDMSHYHPDVSSYNDLPEPVD